MGKFGFIKIKNVGTPKDTIKKKNRQATDQEKIFSNHIYLIKGLVPKIYKELLQCSNKETTQLKDLVDHSPKMTYKWLKST